MKKYLESFKLFAERGLSIAAFIFPFIEVASYFGPKVFLNTENDDLRIFYLNHLIKMTSFYTDNSLLIFIFMIWIFIVCSRGSVPLTKFLRFNVIQAILLNIICSCSGVIFSITTTPTLSFSSCIIISVFDIVTISLFEIRSILYINRAL